MLAADSFRFLNVAGWVRNAADWNDPAQEKLWLYNLHYFDDLNALGAADRVGWQRALIERWVAENPPGAGNGWEPYPSSLRLVNWIKWALAGNVLQPVWVESLAVQARWLRRHIEWHLLGNHLFVNAKALVFAGLFFEGAEAAEWLAQGLKILRREVPEQVLADGGHFELSPMYHAIILEDLLDLVNAVGALPEQVSEVVVAQWREVAGRMLAWLEGMIHPDGGITFFNDAAFSIAPDHAALAAYAERLGVKAAASAESEWRTTSPTVIASAAKQSSSLAEAERPGSPRRFAPRDDGLGRDLLSSAGCMHFVDSGYVRLEQGEAVAFLDVAKVGPDYLPGHAHADTLSFELSLFGQRVVVNSGTSQYGLGAERLRQRGTAAHSTVEVDGADSSEVWGGFRVARRARPFGLTIEQDDKAVTVTCAHDGYRRLPGKPVHRRRWCLGEHALQVADFIENDFRKAVARYYLHPSVVVSGEGLAGQMELPGGRAVRWSVVGGTARLAAGTWHPEFGLSIPCKCLEVVFDGQQAHVDFAWD
ncbi:alginate lyase family protein [Accumulibacter sp.]|uniref:heparinase II/III family protein n=1 Tax=Accumulibacter sp. TaxID=2053492 RepID=UPI0028C38D2E|nr:alginate lyase family protein [Accumulibacter sp.]